jgi:hypothetical protein
MDKAHDVEAAAVAGRILRLRVDGQEYRIDLAEVSDRLAAATPRQRAHYEISPAGYGIHWPDVDEDLSIDGLIGAAHPCPLAAAEA